MVSKRIVDAIFMNQPELHIGKMIKAELHQQGQTTIWLAEQLNFSRRNVYKIYRRSWIQTDLLLKISLILNRNFFLEYTNEYEKQFTFLS